MGKWQVTSTGVNPELDSARAITGPDQLIKGGGQAEGEAEDTVMEVLVLELILGWLGRKGVNEKDRG